MTPQVGKAQSSVPEILSALKAYELNCLSRELGRQLEWGEVHQAMAEALGVRVNPVLNVNRGRAFERYRSFRPDVALSIRFGSILQSEAIAVPRLGVINLHSGLLPEFRGIMATFWSMLQARAVYGYTIHSITDAGIDTGNIICRVVLPLESRANYFTKTLELYRSAVPELAAQLKILNTAGQLKTGAQQGLPQYFGLPEAADLQRFHELGCTLFDEGQPL
jgi:methionyl-tRNA formyltransferase